MDKTRHPFLVRHSCSQVVATHKSCFLGLWFETTMDAHKRQGIAIEIYSLRSTPTYKVLPLFTPFPCRIWITPFTLANLEKIFSLSCHFISLNYLQQLQTEFSSNRPQDCWQYYCKFCLKGVVILSVAALKAVDNSDLLLILL